MIEPIISENVLDIGDVCIQFGCNETELLNLLKCDTVDDLMHSFQHKRSTRKRLDAIAIILKKLESWQNRDGKIFNSRRTVYEFFVSYEIRNFGFNTTAQALNYYGDDYVCEIIFDISSAYEPDE